MRQRPAWLLSGVAAALLFGGANALAGGGVGSTELKFRFEIELPRELVSALKDFDAGFRVWRQREFAPDLLRYYKFTTRQTPSIVLGDFDGDGARDVALWGRNATSKLFLVAFHRDGRYEIHEVERYGLMHPEIAYFDGEKYGLESFIELVPPQNFKPHIEKKPLRLQNDGIGFVAFERAGSLYYFEKGRFREYALSD